MTEPVTAVDGPTLATKLHYVAASTQDGDQLFRDWLHIAANFIAMKCPRWIPVSERLPEEDREVLVSCKGDRCTGYVDQFGDWWLALVDGGGRRKIFELEPPDHWMPLPEPPTDVA